ncbi:MAG: hypothetical protein RIR11_387 [Bacteroidota bacterium]|jgi:hypothetical protein
MENVNRLFPIFSIEKDKVGVCRTEKTTDFFPQKRGNVLFCRSFGAKLGRKKQSKY